MNMEHSYTTLESRVCPGLDDGANMAAPGASGNQLEHKPGSGRDDGAAFAAVATHLRAIEHLTYPPIRPRLALVSIYKIPLIRSVTDRKGATPTECASLHSWIYTLCRLGYAVSAPPRFGDWIYLYFKTSKYTKQRIERSEC